MKKVLAILALGAFVISVNAQDQKNVIKANPLGLLFGSANLSYERAITKKTSLQIDGNYGSLSFAGTKYTNMGIGADYKFYLSSSKMAPRGFYAAPGVAFSSIKIDDGSNSATTSSFIVKGVIGYQWIWSGGFSLDLFGGIADYTGGKATINGVEYTKFSGILPTIGISLGYAW